MLRDTAKKPQPTAVKGPKCEHDNQKSMTRVDEAQRQQGVADQKRSRPIAMLASQAGIRFRKDMIVPLTLNVSVGVAPYKLKPLPGGQRIPG